jgi:molybdate transport system regulatory protein
MPISARNRIQGQVTDIHAGEVMSLVTIQAGDHRLVASVTNDGVNEIQLKPKDSVTAVIKSTEVMLIKGESGALKISARNKLKGLVTSIQKGEAMGLIAVAVGSLQFGAAITRKAIDEMQLVVGDTVTVVIKATEVMLMK